MKRIAVATLVADVDWDAAIFTDDWGRERVCCLGNDFGQKLYIRVCRVSEVIIKWAHAAMWAAGRLVRSVE
jgi:hypothetical protein